MKITLNLSPAPSLRDRYALVWAVPAVILGLAALFHLGRASLREVREYRAVEMQLQDVQARSLDLRSQETAIRRVLDGPESRQLLRQAAFVNKLIDRRHLSLTQLTSRVAGLLPEDTHLTGLGLTPPAKPGDDYVVRMAINAKGEDSIETLLNDLEAAPDFKDVTLINQGFQEETVQSEQVNVVCTARYLPGVNPDAEKPSEEEPTTNRHPNR